MSRATICSHHAMGFALTSGISFCTIGQQLLFLDMERDRYFCLAHQANVTFRQLIAGERMNAEQERTICALAAGGLLIVTDDDQVPLPCDSPGSSSASLLDRERPCRAVDVVIAGIELVRAKRALRRKRWPRVLACLADGKRQLDPRDTSDNALSEIATAFQRLGNIITPHDQCVPRSVAVMRRSLAKGLAPTLVIGVRLRPFAAHCWVQHRHLLVNERVDLARNFTPILTV